jgi:hypothetical protein
MAFTRDELVAYEKAAPAAPESVSAPPVAIPPVTEPPATPEPAVDSSHAAEPDSADPSDASSAEPAEPASAAAPDSPPAEPVAPEARSRQTIPYDRFQEVVDERNSLRKYGEHLLSTIEDLRKGGAPPAAPAAKPAAPTTSVEIDDKPPTLESVGFDPVKFSQATNEWLAKAVDRRVNAAVQNVVSQRTAEAVVAAHDARATEFAKTHSDFAVVVRNPNLPTLDTMAANAVIRSEHGPAIQYHLSKNPDVATRIAKLSREDQMMAIGRIEAQVSAAPPAAPAAAPPKAAKQKSVTQAPPPPTLTPGGSSAVPKRMEDMNMDEWVAHDRAQKLASRKQAQDLRTALRR